MRRGASPSPSRRSRRPWRSSTRGRLQRCGAQGDARRRAGARARGPYRLGPYTRSPRSSATRAGRARTGCPSTPGCAPTGGWGRDPAPRAALNADPRHRRRVGRVGGDALPRERPVRRSRGTRAHRGGPREGHRALRRAQRRDAPQRSSAGHARDRRATDRFPRLRACAPDAGSVFVGGAGGVKVRAPDPAAGGTP